ncbi:MAG: IS21 family transposase [Lachnospiraceae bacterium]|nr:IS21 family transposase [Lachnospiraceae bacterium]
MEEHDKLSKLTMWSKINEFISDGLNYSEISRRLNIDRHTVSLYASMNYDEFVSSQSYNRHYSHKLDAYEDYVVAYLTKYPEVSAARVHDRLKEAYPDLCNVTAKTVFNFVRRLRLTHNIPKAEEGVREMNKLPEPPYGEYAQVDFGEKWVRRADGGSVKVYFFVMVLSRSRYKFVYFSRTPFTTVTAIYAHQLAFQYFGGKPKKIIYDQDRVFIHDENLGDYRLTARFRSFISSEGLDVIFCRKSDPQSKGKVENVVRYVKRNFLSGREFKDIETLNREAVAWLERTANGTEHHGIRRIPSEVFAYEIKALTPYTAIPSIPDQTMEQRVVRQDNTIMFDGCFYTVPSGTYRGRDTQVYVEHKDNMVNIYSTESGKTIASHPYSMDKGSLVRNFNHLRHPSVSLDDYRKLVEKMLPSCEAASEWLDRVQEGKPRYFRDNLRVIERESHRYDDQTLADALQTCLEAGAYNARMLMDVAEGERIRMNKPIMAKPFDPSPSPVMDIMGDQIPERSQIKTYDDILTTTI